ncbi:MAG: diguanylate cyclase [Actinobacteria bacterium]|nr:diguanylate cyclase [Actinomycetota bacterium]
MGLALLHRDAGELDDSPTSATPESSLPEIPGWLATLAALSLAAFVVLIAVVIANPMGEATLPNLLDDVGLLFAVATCAYAFTRTTGDIRKMWALLALAMLSWMAGEVVFDVRMQTLGLGDESSVADIGYALFYPLALAGLWIRDRATRRPGLDARMLDSLIATFAVALLTLKLIYEPVAESGASTLSDVLRIAYPTVDILLIWVIVYQAYNVEVVWDTSRRLLALALSLFLVADLYWAGLGAEVYAVVSSAAALCLGAAAIASPTHDRLRDIADVKSSPWVPSAVLVLSLGAVVALAVNEYAHHGAMTIVGASVVMAMVVARLLLTLAQNSRLLAESQQRAVSDPLTGLRNHQYFQDRLSEEVKRSIREERPVALLAIDIDNFKSINDLAGHRAGDRVLKEVAAAMTDISRATDVACRTGGDELAIIAPDCDNDTAVMLADRLRRAVSGLSIPELGANPHPSISIGCCTYPELAGSAFELADNADAALYSAKHSGRNTVKLYDPGSPDGTQDAAQLERVQAQLAARNADFRAVFAHAHDAMVISDESGRILLVNEAAVRMVGGRREAMIGRNAADFVVPEKAEEFERLVEHTVREGHSSGTMGVVLPSGRGATVELTTARFSQNRYLTTVRDVTDARAATTELAKSEARFRGVFENALDAMFIIDDEGVVRDANRAACELTERSMLELIGSRVDELVQPEEVAEVAAQRAGLQSEQTQIGIFHTRDRHGRRRTVEYSAVADFTPGLHLAIVREITGRVGAPPIDG